MAVGVALCAAAPAAAQEEDRDESVAWGDPCGDAATLVRAGDTRVPVGDTSASPLDIRAVEMRWVRGGVRMQMDVCGPLGDTSPVPRSWSVAGDATPYLPAGTVLRSLEGSTYDVRSSPVGYFNPQYTTVELHGAGRDAASSDLSISLG